MDVQVFGVKKSADTRKALRFFAERRVRTHFVDLNRPGNDLVTSIITDIHSKFPTIGKETVSFAAHKSCGCAARPEFEGGDYGPEASVVQYMASQKNRTPEQRAQVRALTGW